MPSLMQETQVSQVMQVSVAWVDFWVIGLRRTVRTVPNHTGYYLQNEADQPALMNGGSNADSIKR